ncbi:hypothetical protein KDW_43250 [Dictyobacter vulcani]|uniref:Chorismate-utilising enzyme C-terminal domain-containing protein n=1 Tax=Dictyobacter vulcani TaxID=2607529 RepID=A0A5J4KRB0_9CHLR|nr:hypothetical protein KDW_43250 [Dictyobacter vulcani]
MVTINTQASDLSILSIEKSLLEAVSEASKKASQLGRGILVSFSQRVKPFDAIHILRTLQHYRTEEYFFWEQPAKHTAIVGSGITESIQTQGEERFTSAHVIWRRLQEHAIMVTPPDEPNDELSSPLLFGGFSFDTHTPHTSLWEGFPDGLLILPQLLLRQDVHHAICSINAIIKPEDDVKRCAKTMTRRLQQLYVLLEQEPVENRHIEDTTSTQLTFQNVRPADDWKALIARTTRQIQHGVYEKVVLARAVNATVKNGTIDVSNVLTQLKQNYANASIFALQRGERCFVGATPEQLVSIQGGRFQTMALAGSAPRGPMKRKISTSGMNCWRVEKIRVNTISSLPASNRSSISSAGIFGFLRSHISLNSRMSNI